MSTGKTSHLQFLHSVRWPPWPTTQVRQPLWQSFGKYNNPWMFYAKNIMSIKSKIIEKPIWHTLQVFGTKLDALCIWKIGIIIIFFYFRRKNAECYWRSKFDLGPYLVSRKVKVFVLLNNFPNLLRTERKPWSRNYSPSISSQPTRCYRMEESLS